MPHVEMLQPFKALGEGDRFAKNRKVPRQFRMGVEEFLLVLVPTLKPAKRAERSRKPSRFVAPDMALRRIFVSWLEQFNPRDCWIGRINWNRSKPQFCVRIIIPRLPPFHRPAIVRGGCHIQPDGAFLVPRAQPILPVLPELEGILLPSKHKRGTSKKGGLSRPIVPDDNVPTGPAVWRRNPLGMGEYADVLKGNAGEMHSLRDKSDLFWGKWFEAQRDSTPSRSPARNNEGWRNFTPHRNRVVSRDRLLERVWGYERIVETRSVDVHVGRLRTKLGTVGRQIETVVGLGYRFIDEKSG